MITFLQTVLASIRMVAALIFITAIGVLVAGVFLPPFGKSDAMLAANFAAWGALFLTVIAALLRLAVAGRRRLGADGGPLAADLVSDAIYDVLLMLGGVYLDVLFGICLEQAWHGTRAPRDLALFGGLLGVALVATAVGGVRMARYARAVVEMPAPPP